MRLAPIFMVLMLLLLLWQPASAEFYRYVDKHGNVLYTDDVSKIPVEQREQARAYEESRGRAQQVAPSPAANREASNEEAAAPAGKEDSEFNALENEKTQLDAEYDQLKRERAILDEAKKNAVTPEQIKTYNEQIVEYNTRATALQEKFDAHGEKVKAYKERKKAQKAPPETEEQ